MADQFSGLDTRANRNRTRKIVHTCDLQKRTELLPGVIVELLHIIVYILCQLLSCINNLIPIIIA